MSTEPSAPSAEPYARAVRHAGPMRSACLSTPSGRWVALGLQGETGTRWDVVDLSCAAIVGADGAAPLTSATVRDWARDGVTDAIIMYISVYSPGN